MRPRQQAGHMIASDPIPHAAVSLASRGPSTYGSPLSRGRADCFTSSQRDGGKDELWQFDAFPKPALRSFRDLVKSAGSPLCSRMVGLGQHCCYHYRANNEHDRDQQVGWRTRREMKTSYAEFFKYALILVAVATLPVLI